MWQRILALVRKEFLALLRDPKSRTVLIVPPIIQLLVFGYATTFDLKEVRYAVYNEDRGGAARELLARFDGAGIFKQVAELGSEKEMAPLVDAREVLLVLHVGPRFSADLLAGRPAPLQLIVDGRNSNTAMVALNYVRGIVGRFNDDWIAARGSQGPPARLVTRAWFNPNLESRWNIVPALIASLSMIQTLLLAALSVAREREQGTFDQLLVTPLRPMEILIGKASPAITIGLVQASLVFCVALFWFRIPFQGSLVVLYVGLVAFTTACVGIGLSISALSLNMHQAMVYAFVLIMPLILLSGLVTPVGNMPTALQILTYADPLRFAIDLVRRVYLEGAGWQDVGMDFVPMLVIAAITLPVAAWLFRNRLT